MLSGSFRSASHELSSPLKGVSAAQWTRFVRALEVQAIGAVSESGGFGSYDMRPRRLVELGYAKDLRSVRNEDGRTIRVCEFILPWTQDRFLADPILQYKVLSQSISLYLKALVGGDLKRPEDASVAGVLAVLHVGGRGALAGWPDLFIDTRARYDAARGAF
jgi:hypothetical protein